jgi:DNA repair protein RadC
MTNTCDLNLFKITEVELVYRNTMKPSERPIIRTAESSYNLLMQAWDMNRISLLEEFKLILLDNGANFLGISEIARGGITGCVVDPRIVFATALTARATRIILAHNHPSAYLMPSKEDLLITQKLVNAGTCLDIKVLDHLIISQHQYMSMAEHGILPGPTI